MKDEIPYHLCSLLLYFVSSVIIYYNASGWLIVALLIWTGAVRLEDKIK